MHGLFFLANYVFDRNEMCVS